MSTARKPETDGSRLFGALMAGDAAGAQAIMEESRPAAAEEVIEPAAEVAPALTITTPSRYAGSMWPFLVGLEVLPDCEISVAGIARTNTQEDARRIIAALNATDGIETEYLECMSKGAMTTLRDRNRTDKTVMLDAIKKALIDCVDLIETDAGHALKNAVDQAEGRNG